MCLCGCGRRARPRSATVRLRSVLRNTNRLEDAHARCAHEQTRKTGESFAPQWARRVAAAGADRRRLKAGMSGAVSSELSEYEKQRLANIARNEAALAALGIGQAKRDMAAAERERARARVVVNRPKQSVAYGPARTSSRIAGKPGPTYAEVAEEAKAQSSAAWVGRRNTSSRDFYATGFNNTVWPTQEQVAKAAAAAEETVAASQMPASVKVMLPSHVSGGYWLQLPVDLAEHLPGSMGKHRFRLLDSTGAEPASGGAGGFPVIWLRRGGSGGGLSGGWRGFAIDRELGVGDVVAFEKMDGNKLRATIHRAITLEERHSLAMSHSASAGSGSPLAEPKKALSAFMIFSAVVRPDLMKQSGDLATAQKRIGELWREMPDTEKQEYHAKAKLDRQRYLKERLEHDEANDSEDSEIESAQESTIGSDKESEIVTPSLQTRAGTRKRVAKQPSDGTGKRKRTVSPRTYKHKVAREQEQEQEQVDEELYEVERIVGKKKGFYKIHWKGYATSYDTWEPSAAIKAGAPEAVAAWEASSKTSGITKSARVKVKFGRDMYAGTVTRVHKKQATQQPDFDVLFDVDGETWKIQPGLHIFKLL